MQELINQLEELRKRVEALEARPVPLNYQNSNAGINTTNPDMRLHVYQTGTAAIKVAQGGFLQSVASGSFQISEGAFFANNQWNPVATGAALFTLADGDFYFLNSLHASGGPVSFTERAKLFSKGGMSFDGITDYHLRMKTITLASGTTAQLPFVSGNGAGTQGFALVTDGTNSGAIFYFGAGSNFTVEIFDAGGNYSIAAGTGGSTNIYWSAGNSRYEIQNLRGPTMGYRVFFLLTR